MRLSSVISFLLFYFVALQMLIKPCNGCLEKERTGLLEIKAQFVALLGDFAVSWVDDRSSNCCSWEHVKCGASNNISTTEQHVTELSLHDLTLYTADSVGWVLNFSLFAPFQELLSLDLSGNLYSDSIHSEGIQNLKSLKVLDLSSNFLNGSIEGLCELEDLIELSLSTNKFDGQIPECLSILRNLRVLDLSQNLFIGNFPSFIANLTSLEYLSLYGNYLEGTFSLSTLANHSKLQILYISSQNPKAQVETEMTPWFPTFQLKSLMLRGCNLNMDKGSTIPSFLLHQKDLQLIDLSGNKLVGAFPNWLMQNNSRLKIFWLMSNLFEGNLQLSSVKQDINQLDISNNNIGGSLSKDIGTFLPGVVFLNLSMNNFEGNIPASIGEMKGLGNLDLSHNHFSGELPEQLATSQHLSILKLSNNFLQGNILNFSLCERIYELYLDNNNFSGTLELVLANLSVPVLSTLDISNNSISGEIPSSIGRNFKFLQNLLMAENELEGEIPLGFSNLTLSMLDLSQNRLFGSISQINLSSMQYLHLRKNDFSGSVPSTLSSGSSLITLDLMDNKFSGSIPRWMDQLSKLRVLSLGGNNLNGHIPIQLCQLKQITIMDLSRNNITGSIPSCFYNSSFGMTEDEYSVYLIDSSIYPRTSDSLIASIYNATVSIFIPDSYYLVKYDRLQDLEFRTKNNYYSYRGNILENMTGMDLSCNMLTGKIPSELGNLQQIRALNLSHNFLSGSIPNTFSNLSQIESLDLSYNNLSGEIPSQLIELNFLSIFNVSYNNLSGRPPSTGQFGSFDDDSYRGNPGLCGPLLKHKCDNVAASPPAESNNTETKESAVDMVAFYWSFIASYATILMGIIAVFCINANWRRVWFYYVGKFVRKCFPSFPMY